MHYISVFSFSSRHDAISCRFVFFPRSIEKNLLIGKEVCYYIISHIYTRSTHNANVSYLRKFACLFWYRTWLTVSSAYAYERVNRLFYRCLHWHKRHKLLSFGYLIPMNKINCYLIYSPRGEKKFKEKIFIRICNNRENTFSCKDSIEYQNNKNE